MNPLANLWRGVQRRPLLAAWYALGIVGVATVDLLTRHL